MGTTYKHTPLPWHCGVGNGEGHIFGASGRMRMESAGTTLYPICEMAKGWNEEEDKANEEFIVAACNNFEKLYGCLNAVRVMLKHCDPGEVHDDVMELLPRIEEVLKEAEVGA
jgi:hypothetical protein